MNVFFLSAFYYSFLAYFLFFGFYDVISDSTLSPHLKTIGIFVDLLSVVFILMNLYMKPENLGLLYYTLGFALLGWYAYYTPQDIKATGYTEWRHTLYVVVDILMVVCILGASMFFTALEKRITKNGCEDIGDKMVICSHPR